VDGGQRVSSVLRVPDSVATLARRALRWWPIGAAVAAITAAIGLSLAWESPRVYVSRATVYAPSSVANAAGAQRYIADLLAAINSPTVQQDVADELGLHRSAFGSPIEVQRIRQSTLMQVVMRSPDRLADPSRVLNALVARAGKSLSAADVKAAQAQQQQAAAAVTAAEDAAVAATDKRDAFLRARDEVIPATELAIVGPELAEARLCATGAIVPPGGDPAGCQARVDQLQQQVITLGQDADQLAALDRDLAQAESDVADANRDQRDADTAAARAAIGPAVEVAQAGTPVSRVPSLLRRTLAILAGSLLLGVAVVVAIALLSDPDRHPQPETGSSDLGDRRKRAPS
jgi:hypothetical protein